jgi:hypothetical protein
LNCERVYLHGYDAGLQARPGTGGDYHPKHEKHNRMLEWYGRKFGPEEVEIGRILDNFERLAKKWAPKPRKAKATPKLL